MPYLLGIALAYYYFEKGGAKNTQRVHVSKPVIALAWLVIAVIMGLSVFGSYGMKKDGGPNSSDCTWNQAQNYMSMIFNTTGWSVAICFIVWAGLFGYGGWVTDILASDIFCPLSRLVYGAYLVHPMLMYTLDYSSSHEIDFYWYRINIEFFGLAVASFGLSLLGHLLIEKPLNNVQKIVLPAGR